MSKLSPKKESWPHLIVLIVCAGIITGAWLLTPPSHIEEGLRLFGVRLPPVCTFRRTTGLPCPGCGLTRSLTEIIHGHIASGFEYHPLGLLTLIYLTLQAAYRSLWLTWPRLRSRLQSWGAYLNSAFIYLAVLYGLNWFHRILELAAGF
jgi:hypothetical protein